MNPDALRSQVRANKACRGSTLIETLVATGIAATVLAALCLLSMFASRSFAALGNYSDLDRASRNALDRMTRDIRSASYLVSYATNQLVFNVAGTTNLTFTWNPAARTVVRSKTGEADATLLIDCDYLNFKTYQRNMSNQVFGAFSNSTVQTCKLVDLSWRCSRTILQRAVNTESIQTAKIVIRNEHPH